MMYYHSAAPQFGTRAIHRPRRRRTTCPILSYSSSERIPPGTIACAWRSKPSLSRMLPSRKRYARGIPRVTERRGRL